MAKHPLKKFSAEIINWMNCIWLTDLPPHAKYIACYLRKFMNDNQHLAWPSYNRMIDETGLSRQSIAKYLSLLESEGWIIRDREAGVSTVYQATLPENLREEVSNIDLTIRGAVRRKKRKTSSPEELPENKGSSPEELPVVRHVDRGSLPEELPLVRQLDSNKQSNKQGNKQSNKQVVVKPKNDFVIPEGLNLEAWELWLQYRKESKFKPYKNTPLSAGVQMRKLIQLGGDAAGQEKVVKYAIYRGWQGLFPIQEPKQQPARMSAEEERYQREQAWASRDNWKNEDQLL